MKIAILTQPLHNNYGGILQNYALQVVLKKLGHDPTTLDIAYKQPEWPFHIRVSKFVWRLIKKIFGDQSILFCDIKRQWLFLNRPGREQSRFIQTYLNVLHFDERLSESVCDCFHYDAYIVGSDQVWRPRFSPYLMNYFLDFTRKRDVLRLSYAASFGTDCWEGVASDIDDIIPLMKEFNAISVREESGVSICRNTFGIDAHCVLDPTLLLSRDQYSLLFPYQEKAQSASYLAVYILDWSKATEHLVKRVCNEKRLTPLYIGKLNRHGFPSIESWLSGIFNSDYVLTDSFHGTVFSIIAHKQFITVTNPGRGSSRFESLLGRIGLLSRLTDNKHCSSINEMIDYQVVEEKLSRLKEESMSFLKKNLNG